MTEIQELLRCILTRIFLNLQGWKIVDIGVYDGIIN